MKQQSMESKMLGVILRDRIENKELKKKNQNYRYHQENSRIKVAMGRRRIVDGNI